MSLSKPKLTNPCKKFIKFKGDKGIFQFWDKPNEKNVELSSPVRFIVLDELATITGFSDEFQCGIYSNEIHNLRDETLNVRLFKGNHRIVGKYTDIKGDIKQMGGKFCQSVYVALLNDKEEMELANFQLTGAALSAWMDCGIDKSAFGVLFEDCEDKKKGKVEYKMPIFKRFDVSRDVMEKAFKMDENLQKFLKEYCQQQIVKEEAKQQEGVQPDVEDENIPF